METRSKSTGCVLHSPFLNPSFPANIVNRYEAGWRAVMAYTDGVILVYDPDAAGQDQQLTLWYDFFVKRNGLRDEQCLIFAHRGNSNEKFKPRKSPPTNAG